MSISTIRIGARDYISYASEEESDAQLYVDPARRGVWTGLRRADKAVFLIGATHRLDELRWMGRKTGGRGQKNAWPRSGLSYSNGSSVPADSISNEIERATILQAGDLAVSPSGAPAGAAYEESAVRSERIGPKSVSYFSRRRRETSANAPIAEQSALSLVSQWLEGETAGISAPVATGTEGVSAFEPMDRYGRTEGIP